MQRFLPTQFSCSVFSWCEATFVRVCITEDERDEKVAYILHTSFWRNLTYSHDWSSQCKTEGLTKSAILWVWALLTTLVHVIFDINVPLAKERENRLTKCEQRAYIAQEEREHKNLECRLLWLRVELLKWSLQSKADVKSEHSTFSGRAQCYARVWRNKAPCSSSSLNLFYCFTN